jgi:hypothetical protein
MVGFVLLSSVTTNDNKPSTIVFPNHTFSILAEIHVGGDNNKENTYPWFTRDSFCYWQTQTFFLWRVVTFLKCVLRMGTVPSIARQL